MRQGWSLKAMHRLIVTSAVYRQSSLASPDLYNRDPDNVLLARGSRYRVDAELIRDIGLNLGGLLDHTVGGPSVFPSQPDEATTGYGGSFRWHESPGADKYRRGLYTFRKRTAPYAAFATFDAPAANTCTVSRRRSNTPLQSLALLNDEVMVDAARGLALRIVGQRGDCDADLMRYAFRICVARPPDALELKELLTFYDVQQQRLASGELAATKICGTEQAPAGIALNDFAAWTTVARLLLNLDEVITRQ
jgi:hypothetical protein